MQKMLVKMRVKGKFKMELLTLEEVWLNVNVHEIQSTYSEHVSNHKVE